MPPDERLVTFRPFPCFPYVNCRGIQRVLEVGGVEFLDHFHAGPAVLGDLVDIGPLHQTQANIGMAQAVGRADISIPIFFQV